jgi:ABC-type siderophore export system fused ATPase/permease subunit
MFKTGHASRSPAHAEPRSDSGAATLSLSMVGALVATSMAGMGAVITLAFLGRWLWSLTVFVITVGAIIIIVMKSLLFGRFANQNRPKNKLY